MDHTLSAERCTRHRQMLKPTPTTRRQTPTTTHQSESCHDPAPLRRHARDIVAVKVTSICYNKTNDV